ncbi:MAG: hypothetical protein ABW098_06775 [Candidatus Thiodiazotropha sp.]
MSAKRQMKSKPNWYNSMIHVFLIVEGYVLMDPPLSPGPSPARGEGGYFPFS